ncbi:phosphotransferase family protein [Sphingobium sp. TomTYG45]
MGWLANADDGRRFYLRYQAFEQGGADPYNIRREAAVYAALQNTDVPIPQFVGSHPQYPALLTEFVPGSGNYRRLRDPRQKTAIAEGAMAGLAALHRIDVAALPLSSLGSFATVAEAVRAEIAIWHGMYLETGRRDALVEFVHAWLVENVPDISDPPSLVHGDAGPGNFMYDDGAFTKLIDWELSHLGDPLEDIAWFSMRSAMEPVPDFPDLLRAYEAFSGRQIDHDRVLFYRVLVSWRVVIIRHRNSSGELGGSIVSRALNRRLVVEALAACEGIVLIHPAPLESKSERWTPLYDGVLEALRDSVVGRSDEAIVIAKGKEIAKAVKYLRNIYRLEDALHRRETEAISSLLGERFTSHDQAHAGLLEAIERHSVGTAALIGYFATEAFYETELARDAMGSLASRHFPPLA